MPKIDSIKKTLVLGSGPIIIGQAAEFDYSGTQACQALKEEGIEVVLVNSNPATIMTDKEVADKIYIEPLTIEFIEKIIEKEISETDLDHIKSGPNELVIGNFWIFKGKITILKSSLFPIDPFIIMYTAILMEIIFWIKAKISRFRENKSSKSVVITGGDEIGS